MARGRSERTGIFRVLASIATFLIFLVARYEVTGKENVPRTGAFVITPNHFSNADPVVVGLAVWRAGRAPRYLAKASLFRVPVLGWVMRTSGQVPVERAGARSNEPLKVAREIAASGQGVIIYPEGSLTRDPQLWPMRGKSGAVRTALDAGIPIIPAAHWGDERLIGPDNVLHPWGRKRIRVHFGPPVDLSPFEGRPSDAANLTSATAVVMAAITTELEALRGETAPAVRWDPAAHGQTEIGRIRPR